MIIIKTAKRGKSHPKNIIKKDLPCDIFIFESFLTIFKLHVKLLGSWGQWLKIEPL
jgi:hypothetical protein